VLATLVFPLSLPGATVSGKVRTQTGKPIRRVQVSLESVGGGVGATTETAQDGGFQFEGVAPGPYRLAVRKAGWNTVERRVEAAESGAGQVIIEMKRSNNAGSKPWSARKARR
jgi:hypothetical protein